MLNITARLLTNAHENVYVCIHTIQIIIKLLLSFGIQSWNGLCLHNAPHIVGS